ncbi:MAG: low specificity L-threonine aldolase [Clostridium sp.]|nr:low specificity L-threonine aldolase [Clostridium sp.]
MIQFQCDYQEGAHEKILERLAQTNREQTQGYGCDKYCERAKELILEKCETKTAAVHFLTGGTQTNATVIAAALRPHQGVMAARTAHINVHESGAVEAGGHKVLALPSDNGKLTVNQIEKCYQAHMADESREHTVQPKMVYLSQPTELGTLYSLAELEAVSQVCRKYRLFLYVDGARLGYGLTALDNDMTLADLARLCDVFYIGGTKVGALFGEAVVISNPSLQEDFRYIIKQQGAMLAKGRLLGIQFLTLFEDDLYWRLSKYADELAERIREVLDGKKVPFLAESHTNQIFPILPDAVLQKLEEKYCFCYQERIDETHSAVRICTSWATPKEAVEELCRDLMEALA